MKLIDWMRREGVSDAAFAERISADCGIAAVKKWKYGERVPPPHRIARIEEVTNHEVALRDWIPEPERAAS